MATEASGFRGGCQEAAERPTGLVPYTTSDTGLQVREGTADELSEMVLLSAHLGRLQRMKHHVRTAGRLIKETMARRGRKWRAVFVTLTYRPGVEWAPRHITGFLKNVRMWSRRGGYRAGYVWVAEMQRRGAVHYHAVIWLPAGVRMPRPDKCGWWKHGSTNVQAVQRNGIGYLMKYVSKGLGDSPDLPSGARVCGSGGLDDLARDEMHYWRLPRYVRERIQMGDRCRRAEGGGWVSRATGEHWRSAWGIFAFAKRDRGADCNGNPRRQDGIAVLSAQYRREQGGVGPDWASLYRRVSYAQLWESVVKGQTARRDEVEAMRWLPAGDDFGQADYGTRGHFLVARGVWA